MNMSASTHMTIIYKTKKYRQNDTIYVTNHLIDGFRKQGARVEGNLKKKVAEFRSNPLFDPVYSEIILYEWRSN
ncbi:hypothetical protein GCM10020331_033840 [Ectobacillus funiculus]